ncbi:sensor histidine kinase [Pueribacillus theae]|uniref:histidine kinase n=1 Tax=Pueribacillus theae TaxID=2171751 RepID=A0A2U1JJH8_9BACI|nr:HAMP domain-containing sensor histidine kinase [Pueribacillus theae]PWA05154.1 sensor histidine kinase [Pueribacillus theae]
MGKLNRISNRTLRGQIVSSFHLILVMSILATFVTWGVIGLFFYFLLENERINPANYYESKIPGLVTFVQEQENLLDDENKDKLEKVIPLEGMDYQVVDKEGHVMYGSMPKQYLSSESDLANHLNTNFYDGGKILQYYPVFNETGNLIGAIGFRYELTLTSANPQIPFVFLLGGGLAFLSPFFYFYLVSYVFGKRFSRKIEQPFNEIIEGAHKIGNRDLDFSLSHVKSTKELNQLVAAFEEMKEALKESLHRQWKLEQERRDMIAAVAHDLKTPLTIIQGHVEGLQEMKTFHPERLERYLQTIQASSRRCIQLIRDLEDVSKIEHPEFSLTVKQTDIKDFVLAKAKEYELLSHPKNITLEATFDNISSETKQVWIDPYRINQVLDNILSNSLRYTPQGGVIKWKTTIKEKEIIFEIEDSGPGFSTKNTSEIFEKFYRDDRSRNSEGGHSGLGLFISQMIVKKHHGEIIARNKEESGAYFNILIKNMKEGEDGSES